MVAIILLGIVAVAGGTAATIYVRGGAGAKEVSTEPEGTSASVPVSVQVATSTASEAPGVPGAEMLQIEATISNQSSGPYLRADTTRICAEAKQIPLPLPKESTDNLDPQTEELVDQQALARNSLIGHVHLLCDELLAGNLDEEGLRETEQSLREKWTLWMKTRGNAQ